MPLRREDQVLRNQCLRYLGGPVHLKPFWEVWRVRELRRFIWPYRVQLARQEANYKQICIQIQGLGQHPRETHLHGKWDYGRWHKGWSAYHNMDGVRVFWPASQHPFWQADSTMGRDPEPRVRSIRRKEWRDRRDSGEDRAAPSTSTEGWGGRTASTSTGGWGSGTANTGRGWGAIPGMRKASPGMRKVTFYGKWRYVAYHRPYKDLDTWHADLRKREDWLEQAAKRRGVAFTPAPHTWLWPGNSGAES